MTSITGCQENINGKRKVKGEIDIAFNFKLSYINFTQVAGDDGGLKKNSAENFESF